MVRLRGVVLSRLQFWMIARSLDDGCIDRPRDRSLAKFLARPNPNLCAKQYRLAAGPRGIAHRSR